MQTNKQQLVPALRFPEFEGEWKRVKLGDFLKESIDKVPADTGIPVLTSSRKGLFFQEDYYNNRKIENATEYKLLPFGYMTYRHMSDDSTFKFNINYLVKQGAVSKEYPVFTTTEMDIFLLQQCLNYGSTFRKFAMMQKQGGTRTRLYFKKLTKLKLPLPSLPEQQKIANFLTLIDKKITLLKELSHQLKIFKKGIMQQLFSQQLRFLEENGEAFPDWEVKRLGEIFERVKAKNKENNQNILTISAQLGLISQLEFFNKSVSAKNVTGYYLLEKGDFAYNKSYSNGYPFGAIKKLNRYDKGVVSTLYICFRPKNKQFSYFFEQYFEGSSIEKELYKIAQEGARNHGLLNVSVVDFFELIKLPLPTLPEQKKIAHLLSSLDQEIQLIEAQVQARQEHKKGLLQHMLV